MIMPTKIIQPKQSLWVNSSFVLKSIQEGSSTADEIFDTITKHYNKKFSADQLILCLDFLFLIDKIEINNATFTIKI